jgi:hypothetical protein
MPEVLSTDRLRRITQLCSLLRGLTVLAFIAVLVCGVTGMIASGVEIAGRPLPIVKFMGTDRAEMSPEAGRPFQLPLPPPNARGDVMFFTKRLPVDGGEMPAPRPHGDEGAPAQSLPAPPLPHHGPETKPHSPGPRDHMVFFSERGPVPTTQGWSAYVLAALSIGLVLAVLQQFERLFAAYAEGQIFTERNAIRLATIGGLIVLAGLFPALSVVDAITNRFTGELAPLLVDLQPNMSLAVIGAFLVLVAYLMREGSLLAREVEDTV